MTTTINKTQYEAVAKQINKLVNSFDTAGLDLHVSVLERGTDGLVLLLSDDLYDVAQYAGSVQDLLYTGEIFVVGDNDFYLEPFDSSMTFKLAQ